jgi:hypothetical protein
MQSQSTNARSASQTTLAVRAHDEEIGPVQLAHDHHVGIVFDHIDGQAGRPRLGCHCYLLDRRTDHGLEASIVVADDASCVLGLAKRCRWRPPGMHDAKVGVWRDRYSRGQTADRAIGTVKTDENTGVGTARGLVDQEHWALPKRITRSAVVPTTVCA